MILNFLSEGLLRRALCASSLEDAVPALSLLQLPGEGSACCSQCQGNGKHPQIPVNVFGVQAALRIFLSLLGPHWLPCAPMVSVVWCSSVVFRNGLELMLYLGINWN